MCLRIGEEASVAAAGARRTVVGMRVAVMGPEHGRLGEPLQDCVTE